MGLTGNPRAGNNGVVLTQSAWPGVPETLLKFVQTMQTALLPGPPLDPEGVMQLVAHAQLPAPPAAAPEPPKKPERGGRKKGHDRDAASEDEDDDVPMATGGSTDDVFKARQAAKLRKKT